MIIKSILDTDLYKFTMQQAIVNLFPRAKVKYKFFNRGCTKFPEGFDEALRKELKEMEKLALNKKENDFLLKYPFLSPTYIEFLNGYQFDSSEVGIIQNELGELDISISGYWYRTVLWEVPLMAIISELYFKLTKQAPIDLVDRTNNNNIKKDLFKLNGMHYADFGTRRRYSFSIQNEVVEHFSMKFNKDFVGTSNVYLAFLHKTTPIGTHAHEWFMLHAAKYGYKMANHLAMENWTNVYRGDLGIALSDTFTTDIFFNSFDKKFAKLYDGVRQDSGDPFKFTDKVIKHYKKLNINPLSKVIVFSDGLNPNLALKIKDYCRGKIMCSFGIGTNFSNDVGVTPLNIVIKLIYVKPEEGDWVPAIKLSDSTGKHTGDKKEIEIAKYILNIK